MGRVGIAEALLMRRFQTVESAAYLAAPEAPGPDLRAKAAEVGDPNYLPGGLEGWRVFYTPRVEVWYTIRTEGLLARHALIGQGATFSHELGPRDYRLNRGTPREIHVGRISDRLEDLNRGLGPVQDEERRRGLQARENDHIPPARVQRIGLLAERAIRLFMGPPFLLRDPAPAGERLRIRICDVTDGGSRYPGATRPEWDHVRINGAYLSSELIGTVPHEVFHRIQYRYNDSEGETNGIERALREGGARFAEDIFNGVPNRYLAESAPIFLEPWRSIAAAPGAADPPFDYEAGLFWKYLAEQHGLVTDEQARGVDLYRSVLLATATLDEAGKPLAQAEPSGYDPRLLRAALAGKAWYGHFDRFLYLDDVRTEIVSQETTWGNWLVANHLRGTQAAGADGRFHYREDSDPAPEDRRRQWASDLLRARVLEQDARPLHPGETIRFDPAPANAPAWGGARYYRVLLSPPPAARPGMVEILLDASGPADPLTQVLLLDRDGELRDIVRSDRKQWARTVNAAGLSEIVVVVANREHAGPHSLTVRAAPPSPLVSTTRWNCRAGTSYEVDPAGWRWTWLSPDMDIDRGGAQGSVGPVRLKLRLRNRGTIPARNIKVAFWCQPAGPQFSAALWVPVENQAACAELMPGTEKWLSVDWTPPDGLGLAGWCVKAEIVAPGDPNTDDKIVLGGVAGVARSGGSGGDDRGKDLVADERSEVRLLVRGPGWRCDGPPPKLAGDAAQGRNAMPAQARQLVATNGVLRPARPLAGDIRPRIAPCDDMREWDGARRQDTPGPDEWFPPATTTLPESMRRDEAIGLVTQVFIVDGMAACGATYRAPPEPG
jgi:hypothetical protein